MKTIKAIIFLAIMLTLDGCSGLNVGYSPTAPAPDSLLDCRENASNNGFVMLDDNCDDDIARIIKEQIR